MLLKFLEFLFVFISYACFYRPSNVSKATNFIPSARKSFAQLPKVGREPIVYKTRHGRLLHPTDEKLAYVLKVDSFSLIRLSSLIFGFFGFSLSTLFCFRAASALRVKGTFPLGR